MDHAFVFQLLYEIQQTVTKLFERSSDSSWLYLVEKEFKGVYI